MRRRLSLYDVVSRVIGLVFFGGIGTAFAWFGMQYPTRTPLEWAVTICIFFAGACSYGMGADVVLNGLHHYGE